MLRLVAASLTFFSLLALAENGTVGKCSEVKSYVSQDNCQPDHQCGTVALPFCTISQGIAVGGLVKVAGSAKPYSENLTLRDQVVIEGGYEKSFQGFTAFGSSHLLGNVTFPSRVRATLKRFDIDEVVIAKTESEHLPKRSEAITISGTANGRLEAVRINIGIKMPDYPVAKAASAVFVEEGNGASLELENVDFRALPGEERSVALAWSSQNAHLQAFNASLISNTARRSVAFGVWGSGKFEFVKSEFQPGLASASAGIRAVGPEAKTELSLKISESQVKGSPAVASDLPNPPSHWGISARNANLEIRKSDIVGSLTDNSAVAAAIETKGITKSHLIVEENARILGAVSKKAGYGAGEDVFGILAAGDVDALIRGNKDLRGCAKHCVGSAYGLYLNAAYGYDDRFFTWGDFKSPYMEVRAAPSWKIIANQKIVGGPGPSAATHAGVFALSAFSKKLGDVDPERASLLARENAEVTGSPVYEASALTTSLGIYALSVESTVVKNHLFAGKATGSEGGLGRYAAKFDGSRTVEPVKVIFENNQVEGGPEGTAAEFIGMQAHVEKNSFSHSSVGLSFHTDRASTYVDNKIASDYGVLAGCNPYNSQHSACGRDGSFVFSRNLSYATKDAGWGIILGSRTAESKVSRNIIYGVWPVILYSAFNSTYPEFSHNVVFSNSPAKCVYRRFGSWDCERAKASEFGEGNMGLEGVTFLLSP